VSRCFSRRRVLAAGAGAGAVLGLGAAGGVAASAARVPARRSDEPEETRSLDELYAAAQAEGGTLVIYAGGDLPAQQDATRKAFLARFPNIDLTIVVDYSKYHDVRVDNQLATGTLVPDVVQLQTLQDFDRWAEQGRLLRYKPAGFGKVHQSLRDDHGAWTAVAVIAFSFVYGTTAVGDDAPRTPLDLVDPGWRGKIASSYPHDDDAVLYLYSRYAQTYGWDWVAALAGQEVRFARGSNSPRDAVTAGEKAIGIGGGGSLAAPDTAPVRFVAADDHPFVAWGQRAAILAQAANPTAAKLYLNWQLSAEQQQAAFNGWSVRTDVTPPAGLKPVWDFPNANLDGFPRFMADRAEVERWKQTFALYFGEVTGDPTPGWLGLRPGA
jgi:ABC-type Fe3+ transport system substrate-binding protein